MALRRAACNVSNLCATSASTQSYVRLIRSPEISRPAAIKGFYSAAAETMQVDVTRHNFEETLPAVQHALQNCTFFAIDCEMTGLHQNGYQDEYLDDMETRYAKMASNVSAYQITQFGLSAFTHQAAAGSEADGEGDTYVASTFNFYIFPRPHAFGTSRKFLCDSSSIEFLSNQGFDFNKCIADGISYLPWCHYEKELRQIDKEERARESVVVPSKQEDIDFVQSVIQQVKAWVADGAQGSATLALESANNSYLRLLAFQELGKPQFGAQPEGHTGFHVGKVKNSRWPVILLTRATPEEAAALQAADRAARRESVNAAAGFTRVLDLARRAGRPMVGHNCMLDVGFALASFAEVPLPSSWAGFKTLVAHWFPGGVYDTKHLARQLPYHLLSDTSLGSLYGALTQGTGSVASAARAYVSSAGLPAASCAPKVVHAPGFEKYVAVAAGELAHEAGYDAFMTGSVLVHLTQLLRAKAILEAQKADDAARNGGGGTTAVGDAAKATSASEDTPVLDQLHLSDVPPPVEQQLQPPQPAVSVPLPLQPVQHLMGRLNLMCSGMPYAALFGADPPLTRPNVFFVAGLPGWSTAWDVSQRFAAAGLGKVRSAAAGFGAYFVEVDPAVAPQVLQNMQQPAAAAAAAAGGPQQQPLVVMTYAHSVAWRREAAEAAEREASARAASVKRPAREEAVAGGGGTGGTPQRTAGDGAEGGSPSKSPARGLESVKRRLLELTQRLWTPRQRR